MKKFIVVCLITSILGLSSCSFDMGENLKSPRLGFIDVYTDPETNVDYMLFYSNSGKAICPRYNPDGSLHISK